MKTQQSIYLDHAAGTFLLPEVAELVREFADQAMANPSSIHAPGREANTLLDRSRRTVAKVLGVKHGEIIFTSGGSEANNLAIKGIAQARRGRGKHIISCATEHPSVLDSLKSLEASGFDVSYLPVNHFGEINLDDLRQSITPSTILISLMWINNETGLIHPIEDIARIAREAQIPFHCDGVQAAGHLPLNLSDLSIDALSLSGHKLGAPAGTGVLFLRKGTALGVQAHGGSQENNHRGGTQNLLGAISFARALEIQTERLDTNYSHYQHLYTQLTDKFTPIPGLEINRQGDRYSPHILNCTVKQVDGEAMFIRLDVKHLAVSNGSACTSGSQAPSHVLTALGFEKPQAQASIRISLGLTTTQQEIELFCKQLGEIIQSIRRDP